MKPGEPDALVLYWQTSALEVEIQGTTVDCVIAHHHTVLRHRPDSHQVEHSGSRL